MVSEIDTAAKRSRLAVRRNPYWQGVSGGRGGVSLGFRKGTRGGTWIAKLVLDGERFEERIGDVQDDAGTSSPSALNFRSAVAAALAWSVQQHATAEVRRTTAADDALTVASAVKAYSQERLRRSAEAGRNAEGRLKRHVLSNTAFARLKLAKVRASTIEEWRRGLPGSLAASTVNRLLNDLRAALNAAVERHRRELPAHLAGEIRAGTRAAPVIDVARKQILDAAQVHAIVEAAMAVDVDEDFGRLVVLAAATGGRFSQLAGIRVHDVQVAAGRVMVPGSMKGRCARARPHIAVPVAANVISLLEPILDRAGAEPLLMRWAYSRAEPNDAKAVGQRGRWIKSSRRAWGAADEVEKLWARTVEKAGVPEDTVMYALRHSSIVRGLKAGLPVRLVAALHDTSIVMIEKHYSAFIVDASEELARRATLNIKGV